MIQCRSGYKPSSIDADGEGRDGMLLLKEIFSRLPAKSRHKLKCLSKDNGCSPFDKAWRRQLPFNASGFFTNICHVKNGINSREVKITYTCIFINSSEINPEFVPELNLDFIPFNNKAYILDSCNGLLLCLSYQDDDKKFYVCNPLRKKWVSLPSRTWNNGNVNYARLAHDPKFCPHFKVLIFPGSQEHFPFVRLEIFSSETGNWIKTKVKLAKDWYSWMPLPVFHGWFHVLLSLKNPCHIH